MGARGPIVIGNGGRGPNTEAVIDWSVCDQNKKSLMPLRDFYNT